MSRIAIGIGIMLLVLGLSSYLLTSAASVTALIPVPIGVILAFLGFLIQRGIASQYALYGIIGMSLLGALGTLRAVPGFIALLTGNPPDNLVGVIGQMIMLLLCGVLVVVGIKALRSHTLSRA